MQGKFHLTPGKKWQSLQSTYAYQGFPVRNIRRSNTDDGGAWLVEFKAEKRKDLKALKNKQAPRKSVRAKLLKRFTEDFIKKHCHIEDPKDICILNVSGKNLTTIREEDEDFSFFENVSHINASDNQLNVESFHTFPRLEHLELQVNNITCVHINRNSFLRLHTLDLSYNNITHTALLNLGKLRNILNLYLRGCGLKNLPPQLSRKYQISDSDTQEYKLKAETRSRFPSLTNLDLSENELTDISTFASLAGLRKLKSLSLSCNKICGVPHLRLMAAHRHFSMSTFEQESSTHVHHHIHSDDNTTNSLVDDASKLQASKVTETAMKSELENITEGDEVSKEKQFDDAEQPVTENVEEGETEPQHDDEIIMNAIEKTLSRINSDKDLNDDLMNINFGTELNFSLCNEPGENMIAVSMPSPEQQEEVEDPEEFNICNESQDMTVSDELLDDELRLPFPCLETLDLCYNHIREQESLLTLTGWPVLKDLKLWGNPLMRTHKGIPPLLLYNLNVICGINIHRKEPHRDRKQKPIQHAMISSKKSRRVKTDLPPVKRNDVIAIENLMLQAIESKSTESKECLNLNKEPNNEDNFKESENETVEESPGDQTADGETFFLTQVDEGGFEIENDEYNKVTIEEDHGKRCAFNNEAEDEEELELLQLADYSSLLQIENNDSVEIFIPETIQGSVAALKHVLSNELVFNAGHYSKNKPFKPTKLKKVKKYEKRYSLDEALENIRLCETSFKDNLGNVLNDFESNSEFREKFPQAKKLMSEVQKKYDKVRLKSLRPLSDAEKEFETVSSTFEDPIQVLSRMKRGKIGDFYSASRANTPSVKVKGARYDKTS